MDGNDNHVVFGWIPDCYKVYVVSLGGVLLAGR